MRLYPKKLRNIQDLEREKKILRKQTRALEKDDLFSLENILGKGPGKKDEGKPASFTDMLPIDNPLIKMGLGLLESRIFNRNSGKKSKKQKDTEEDTQPRKNILKTVAFEVLGGYLKWKAIELSFKGIRHIIKKRKAEKGDL